MAVVNVSGDMSNERTQVSVGGRGTSDRVGCHIVGRTAGREVVVATAVEIIGPGLRPAERRRKAGDRRRAVITVDLPDPGADVSIEIYMQGRRIFHSLGLTSKS